MIQGTASHVGKSILATAFCRIFKQDGYRVAPFKAQNMALNAYVTGDGGEIGRAQGVQAEASGVAATVDMNPVLLKPKRDTVAQVIVHGRPVGDFSARDYREDYLEKAWKVVTESFARLAAEYEIIVIEGAGSPAEVNLRDRDIANMRAAALADAPVILVADIDRGGVFAQLVGTIQLLPPDEAARVSGFVINKFRGDSSILEPGLRFLEENTGRPVLGVLPYLPDLGVAAEDSVSLNDGVVRPSTHVRECWALDIAVVRLPRIANFDDFDPLLLEPDVSLRFVTHPALLGIPDLVILPGTKNTVADLHWLYATGWADVISQRAGCGTPVLGVCGGYQMLGKEIRDPEGSEDKAGTFSGLGLLDVATVFLPEKVTARVRGAVTGAGMLAELKGEEVNGYEIHAGKTVPGAEAEPAFVLKRSHGETTEGSIQGAVWGTYLHGLFEADGFRRGFLNLLRKRRGLAPEDFGISFIRCKEASFDRVAATVREHLRLDEVYSWLNL
ncbi:MAG: cobyric acid synthase [Bacillota bacterium]